MVLWSILASLTGAVCSYLTCKKYWDTPVVPVSYLCLYHMSPIMRKPVYCKFENKGVEHLYCNHAADQPLYFRYIDSTIPLLLQSQISSLYPSFVVVQPSLCRTWSKTPKTGFLTKQLISDIISLDVRSVP